MIFGFETSSQNPVFAADLTRILMQIDLGPTGVSLELGRRAVVDDHAVGGRKSIPGRGGDARQLGHFEAADGCGREDDPVVGRGQLDVNLAGPGMGRPVVGLGPDLQQHLVVGAVFSLGDELQPGSA